MNVPDDLKGMYAEALLYSEKSWYWLQIVPSKIISLIERIAALEAENARLGEIFDKYETQVERLSAPVMREELEAILGDARVTGDVSFQMAARQFADKIIAARKGK